MSTNQMNSGAAGITPLESSPLKVESNMQFETGKDATRLLAQYALNTQYEDLPENIQREASRAFVNFVGVTVGSCQHEAVNISINSLRPISQSNQATVLVILLVLLFYLLLLSSKF